MTIGGKKRKRKEKKTNSLLRFLTTILGALIDMITLGRYWTGDLLIRDFKYLQGCCFSLERNSLPTWPW